jgi:hypothetical protein
MLPSDLLNSSCGVIGDDVCQVVGLKEVTTFLTGDSNEEELGEGKIFRNTQIRNTEFSQRKQPTNKQTNKQKTSE